MKNETKDGLPVYEMQQSMPIDSEDLIRALGQHRLNEIVALGTIKGLQARIAELEAGAKRIAETVRDE